MHDCAKLRTQCGLKRRRLHVSRERLLHVFVYANQSFNQGPTQSINQSTNWMIDQAIGRESVPVIEAKRVAYVGCRLGQQWSFLFGHILPNELSLVSLCRIVQFVN